MTLSEEVQAAVDDCNVLTAQVQVLEKLRVDDMALIDRLHAENSDLHQQVERMRAQLWPTFPSKEIRTYDSLAAENERLRINAKWDHRCNENQAHTIRYFQSQARLLEAVRAIEAPKFVDYSIYPQFLLVWNMWWKFQEALGVTDADVPESAEGHQAVACADTGITHVQDDNAENAAKDEEPYVAIIVLDRMFTYE